MLDSSFGCIPTTYGICTAGIQKFSQGENGEKIVIVSQILSGFVLGGDCEKIKCFIRI
jgi:hypothetical protein